MYFDTHCHLNSEELYEQRADYVHKAFAQGVTHLCVVGYNLEASKRAVQIAQEFPNVYCAVGIGPEDCLDTTDDDLNSLESLLSQPKVVALGEIGLDYHWDTVPHEKQQVIFEKQLALAKKYQLPVVIHSRDALQDTYDILKAHQAHGIMHCYSGSKEMAKEFVKIGFKISLAGPVTFKNARVSKDVAREIDLKDLLIETDSPYLTPHPYRGKQNNPSYVVYIAKEIAALKGLDEQEVAMQTTRNAFSVFNMEEKA